MAQPVALVFPPIWDTVDVPPLGPAVLAGALRNADIPSAFFDVNLDFYGWLLSDRSLSELVDMVSRHCSAEEQSQMERLLSLAQAERGVAPDRVAAMLGLAVSLGMLERPLLGPQRFLAGIHSSEVRLAELVSATPQGKVAAFWHEWMDARAQAIAEAKPCVVAITISHVGQLLASAALAHRLRERLPNTPLLAGGPYCTTMATSDANLSALFAAFDAIGVGAGDEVIVLAARSPGELPRDLPGLWVADEPRPRVGVPTPSSPDFSVMGLERYSSGQQSRLIPLETSRGCWGRCRYCNYVQLNRGYRVKPIDQVAAEVLELQTRTPGARISFVDDTLAPRRALQLAQAIARISQQLGHVIEWEGCLRPDAGLELAQCQELSSGGMFRVFIGFDAATEGMLREIDKRATLHDLRGLVTNLLTANIVVSGNFIVGLPGEAESDRRAVLELIDELGLDRSQVTASLFGLARGSWYYEHIDEMGWPEDWVARVKANDVLTDFLPTPRARQRRPLNKSAVRVLGRDLS